MKQKNNLFLIVICASLIFCLPVSESELRGYWNVLNSSNKGVKPFCSDAASVLHFIGQPEELQLSLVVNCNTRQRNGSTELQGWNPKPPQRQWSPRNIRYLRMLRHQSSPYFLEKFCLLKGRRCKTVLQVSALLQLVLQHRSWHTTATGEEPRKHPTALKSQQEKNRENTFLLSQ